MTEHLPFPPALARQARDFRGTPVPVRPAATVVLLHPTTLHVYLQRRAATMAFGGMFAFPGGRVDPTDRPTTVRPDWARRLGVPEEQARAVVGAAIRELFEETGVLLAGRADEPDHTVSDLGPDDGEADRAAVAARDLSMTDLLARRGLRLRDDLLLPWSRWITPEFAPQRFDTWFFVALLPDGQRTHDVSGESEETRWVSPAGSAELAMLPPTRATLDSLRPHRTAADVVAAAARRDAATPVHARVEATEDGGAVLSID
ncbi:NUDIX hydrolase [Mangrovihabitans endophyticus]|uniref:Nudix hydrolase domain-containing protein n=1 Tax=Mangrovihabitans endophyticus TaxID=1751298 RepID=A0A8J3BW92_9ACTN|nr:NUDIX domain-containing protein [Mangrovihabitans endophyticus]GGK82627.1 hypothetical protein GCM10012284_15770 [Mangrovihabitans endophyticus]